MKQTNLDFCPINEMFWLKPHKINHQNPRHECRGNSNNQKTESLAQKSGFNSSILNIAEQINQDWWKENGENFLKGVMS